MKARTSFLMKGIYFILVLIIIAVILNQIVSLNIKTVEEEKRIELMDKSTDILETLAGNKRCLGYVEPGSIEGKDISLTLHRVIDIEKLKYFSSEFSDVEPDCAKDFEFGYRVKVENFPINISTHTVERQDAVFGKILKLIDGKKTVFVLDSSGSMNGDAGSCSVDTKYPDSKICCLKQFMYGFIDELKTGSGIAVNVYGYHSTPYQWLISPFEILNGNRANLKNEISTLTPEDGTPMCKGLEAAFEFAKDNRVEAIVLLTDGTENDVCVYPKCPGSTGSGPSSADIARDYVDSGIPVHTVGFGTEGVCYPVLEEVASISGGEFFTAETCEELISESETVNFTIPREVWWFGDRYFSKEEALKDSVKVSIPVILRYNISTFVPGKMTITLVNGEFEKLIGFVEQSCLTETNSITSLVLHYPTRLDVRDGINYLCMEFLDEERCQRLACEKDIEFSGTRAPGNYRIYTRHEVDKLKIIV